MLPSSGAATGVCYEVTLAVYDGASECIFAVPCPLPSYPRRPQRNSCLDVLDTTVPFAPRLWYRCLSKPDPRNRPGYPNYPEWNCQIQGIRFCDELVMVAKVASSYKGDVVGTQEGGKFPLTKITVVAQ